MRQALVVGINYYNHGSVPSLFGCVDDAHAVRSVLERNSDGSVNFDVKLLTGTGPTDIVSKAELRGNIETLFSGESETALFYFAGHGYIDSTGGYILGSDASDGHDGIPLSHIVSFANKSRSRNKIIVLDSCHSGSVGANPNAPDSSDLKEGLTILTASTAEQYASEIDGHGVFTDLFVDALNGGASNLLGAVTPGSIYAYIDQSLGTWEQRPVFKTNVKNFVSLRSVQAPIALSELQRIAEFFPRPGFEFQLDPSYEPERSPDQAHLPPPDPEKNRIFSILQLYNRVNLVVPVGAPHMYHAAMEGRSCKLTVLGEHYRRLAAKGRI